jgi:hypothetical protein
MIQAFFPSVDVQTVWHWHHQCGSLQACLRFTTSTLFCSMLGEVMIPFPSHHCDGTAPMWRFYCSPSVKPPQVLPVIRVTLRSTEIRLLFIIICNTNE